MKAPMLVMCSVKVDSLSYYIIVLLNYYYFFLDLKMKDALKFPFIMEKKSLIIIIMEMKSIKIIFFLSRKINEGKCLICWVGWSKRDSIVIDCFSFFWAN